MQLKSYNEIKEFNPIINIKSYILDLILTKCNLTFGKTFASVYLQLLVYTNNDKNNKRRGKCWISSKTIAKNINGNVRKINTLLTYMEKINLIEKSYYGRLKMYSLKNNNLTKKEDIINFNNYIEMQLNNYMNIYIEKDKINRINEKFNLINKEYNFNNEYQFRDINLLRQWLITSENISHGSSLMFIIFFAREFINLNKTINSISETILAKKIGFSQSTISRYFNLLKQNNYISIVENSNKPNKIIINKEIEHMEKTQEISNEIFKCPFCNKECETIKKYTGHISRCKDEGHVLFYSLLKENKYKTFEDIINIFNLNKEKFEKFIAEKNKEDNNKKLNGIVMPLIKYYYSLTNTRCPNWGKETTIIKSHLKNGLTTDEIMEVMRYMARRGYIDLSFFANSINDALIIKQCKIDCKQEGTNSYLVKFFYDQMKQKLTDRLMLQGIKKINELKANNFDYIQIKTIIEYMIEKKCPNFNFIVTMANEALTKSKDKKDMTKTYSIKELVNITLNGIIEYGNILLEDYNYEIVKKDIILKLKDDIFNGKVKLTKVNKTYSKFAIELAKEIYNNNFYSNNLTLEQWSEQTEFNKIVQFC